MAKDADEAMPESSWTALAKGKERAGGALTWRVNWRSWKSHEATRVAWTFVLCVSHRTFTPPFKPEVLGKVHVSLLKVLVEMSRGMHATWIDSAPVNLGDVVVSFWLVLLVLRGTHSTRDRFCAQRT